MDPCTSHSRLWTCTHAPHGVQERLLGEDGHPRKVKPEEDPFQLGLVLEWVYGTIVSTAEKARDGAKRPLGTPLAGVWPFVSPFSARVRHRGQAVVMSCMHACTPTLRVSQGRRMCRPLFMDI